MFALPFSRHPVFPAFGEPFYSCAGKCYNNEHLGRICTYPLDKASAAKAAMSDRAAIDKEKRREAKRP